MEIRGDDVAVDLVFISSRHADPVIGLVRPVYCITEPVHGDSAHLWRRPREHETSVPHQDPILCRVIQRHRLDLTGIKIVKISASTKHLYNIYVDPTSKTLGRRCINVI